MLLDKWHVDPSGPKLFSMLTDPLFGPSYADNFSFGPSYSDSYLQETAALTNAFISNNSWNYSDQAFRSVVGTYDLAAASYDAAVRDALPLVSGAQPLLYVFSAGDGGQGMDDGTGGTADSIQSPATAKNVITVGAYESLRKITNSITVITTTVVTGDLMTNVSQPSLVGAVMSCTSTTSPVTPPAPSAGPKEAVPT